MGVGGGKYHRWPTDGRVVIYQPSLEGRLVVIVVRVFFGIFFIEWIRADKASAGFWHLTRKDGFGRPS